MKQPIDNTFTLSSDRYNWILYEKRKGRKMRRRYFSSIKQLCVFLGEFKARECLGKAQVVLGDISSGTPSYSPVIDEIVAKLERHINSIIENDDTCNCKKT